MVYTIIQVLPTDDYKVYLYLLMVKSGYMMQQEFLNMAFSG